MSIPGCRVAHYPSTSVSVEDVLTQLAEQNKDYLYQLETALNSLSKDSGDEHVSDLAERCREIEARQRRQGDGVEKLQDEDVKGEELRKVGSTREQEETEKD